MSALHYLDFDLQIDELEDSSYRVRVLNSPAGQAEGFFSLPFSEQDLEIFFLRIGRPRRSVRRVNSPEMNEARRFGSKLYEAVFQGGLQSCLERSIVITEQQNQGVRLRLRLPASLIELPWEYLYDPSRQRFLSHSTSTPIIRYLDLPQNVKPLSVTPPLKVLVMIASPSDYERLDVEAEWRKIKSALADLEQRELVQLTRLPKANLSALQGHLRREQVHIFHFIGHGGFDQQTQDGVLLLESEDGRSRLVSGNHLGTLLHDHPSLRLAVLNACEGARTAKSDPFAGVAQQLVRQGIPAVIAMQFEITDKAALQLAREFYDALADGYPVDGALAEARKAIFTGENDIEWGTPVLYLRAADGRLFDLVALLPRAEEETGRQGDKGTRAVVKPAKPVSVRTLSVQSIGLLLAVGAVALVWGAWRMFAPVTSVSTPTPAPTLTVQVALAPTNTVLVIATSTAMPQPVPTASNTTAPVPTNTDTALPTPTATESPVPTSTATEEPTSTSTTPPTATATKPPPTATATSTSLGAFLQPLSDRYGMEFVNVPAGEFTMGSPDGEGGDDEHPQHPVNVPDFWIGKTEVTNIQYKAFVEGGGYDNAVWWTAAGWKWRSDNKITQPVCWEDTELNKSDYPVVCVSWYEAMAYTLWLSNQSGLTVRLPSEAEREKAARGTDGRSFPWGDEWDVTTANQRLNYCDNTCEYDIWKDKSVDDGFTKTSPVGSYLWCIRYGWQRLGMDEQ